ncbi:MAG: hypothetical protein OER43_11340 [Gammaproteobacteria bacterium]|nr:hypothetical protein [Gammaproteobacteria bacterium]MDH3412061.1 hypothetical protein [Gammaproteobacteria bacterium]
MEKEKRNGEPPVPSGFEDVLSPDQLMTLRQIENFGWQVAFVRRPLFQESVIVVSSTDKRKIAVLENDGQLNLQPEITIRDHAA